MLCGFYLFIFHSSFSVLSAPPREPRQSEIHSSGRREGGGGKKAKRNTNDPTFSIVFLGAQQKAEILEAKQDIYYSIRFRFFQFQTGSGYCGVIRELLRYVCILEAHHVSESQAHVKYTNENSSSRLTSLSPPQKPKDEGNVELASELQEITKLQKQRKRHPQVLPSVNYLM